MEHDARVVANSFIQRGLNADNPFTPLQIQKLVYFAHGWMLGLYGRPLIREQFEAWEYGPVVPVVYYCLSHHRDQQVKVVVPVHPDADIPLDATEEDLAQKVFNKYHGYSGLQMSAVTHASGTPWHTVRRAGRTLIPNSLIQKYYGRFARLVR